MEVERLCSSELLLIGELRLSANRLTKKAMKVKSESAQRETITYTEGYAALMWNIPKLDAVRENIPLFYCILNMRTLF